jgi:xanthosine utilization system XapX-like protein
MHVYATNIPGQHKLLFWIVTAAIIVASGAGLLVSLVASWIGVTVGSVSSLAVFGLLWWWFDRNLWKHPWARRVLLVPDLNGSWKCAGCTITKGGEPVGYEWDAIITITQSWTKMLVRLERPNGTSLSTSLTASLYHEGDGRYRLIYYYMNQPKPSEQELRRHAGLTNLLFDATVNQAEGTYFTDGDRLTVGEMRLIRNGDDHGHTKQA